MAHFTALSSEGVFWFHPVATCVIVHVLGICILSRCVDGRRICMFTQGRKGLLWLSWWLLDGKVSIGEITFRVFVLKEVNFGIQGFVSPSELYALDGGRIDKVGVHGVRIGLPHALWRLASCISVALLCMEINALEPILKKRIPRLFMSMWTWSIL